MRPVSGFILMKRLIFPLNLNWLFMFAFQTDMENIEIVDRCLFCLPIGIDTAALGISSKVYNYFSEHEMMWSKCEAVPTDGARAMVGVQGCCPY